MRPRLRFSWKIFLALGGLVLLSLAVALVVFEALTRRRFEDGFAERFARAQVAFRELQGLRQRFVSDEVASLTRGNPQFRTVLSTASLAQDLGFDMGFGSAEADDAAALRDANLRLRSLVPSLVLAERSDALVVLASDGRLLLSLADPDRVGDDLSGLALFRETAEHGPASGVWTDGSGAPTGARLLPGEPAPAVYQVLGHPVVFEDSVHGVVLAAERIDAATLASIRAVSGLDLALFAGPRLVATTLPEDAAAALVERGAWADLATPDDPEPREPAGFELAGRHFLARRAPVDAAGDGDDAAFLLLAPLDEELAFLRRLRTSLLLAGGTILLAALAPALALTRGITRPVATLAAASRRIGAGDLTARVRIDSGDELGELGRAFNEMVHGLRERDRIRRTFERYVSKEVAGEVLRHPELAPVGGVRRELTACFVDVAGFTALAEREAPESVVALLNEYLEEVCGAVLAFDGTVNEFLGDGVVAFWGAPVPQPDHAARACLAALRARDRLAALAERWRERGVHDPRFRIGLHTGELVVGEIGAQERRAYRAVGDAMNLAARIEGANKLYGTQALASGATLERAGGMVVAREVDRVRVVGRAQPITLYELLAESGDLDPARAALRARYDEALALYRARDFAGAEAGFAACLSLDPEDGPSALLLERARALRREPPGDAWDGVHALEQK